MATHKLNARWGGRTPRIGHYLKARRGRTAYEIVAIKKKPRSPRGHNLILTVVRHSPADVPEGAIVHEWQWDKR